MVYIHKHSPGGNRVSNSRARAFPNEPSRSPGQATAIMRGGRLSWPMVTCPVCELNVRLRPDGARINHRVGSRLQGYWPCPGGGERVA